MGLKMEHDGLVTHYRSIARKKTAIIAVLLVAIVLLAGIAVGIGPIHYSLGDVYATIMSPVIPGVFDIDDTMWTVIMKIRVPRMVMALLTGFGLAIAGAGMQVILGNPLASPFTLGVSSGAGFGAGLAVLAGISFMGGRFFLIGNAFLFSLFPAIVIAGISRIRRATSGMMILAGIAMGYVFSAGSSLMSYFSQAEDLKALSLWMMGNLGRATWSDIAWLTGAFFLSVPVYLYQVHALDVMNAGDETAKSLGVHVERTRLLIMVVSSFITASIICFTGVIGFVGLVAPHITRMFIGANNRFLIPATGLFGAAFLLAADIIALKLIEPTVLPVGVITSFLGGPLFLYLIIRKNRKQYW